MSNAIKDLSVFFSSLIGFKVEWHSSWFGNMIFLTYDIKNINIFYNFHMLGPTSSDVKNIDIFLLLIMVLL